MRAPERFRHWSKDLWPLRRSLFTLIPVPLRQQDDAETVFIRPWDTVGFFATVLHERVGETTIHPSARIHKSAILDGNVHIGRNVVIHPHAHIVGPTHIHDGAEIGDRAIVRSSLIGRQTVIGAMSEVTRSVIGDRTTTHHSFVGDSVICPDVEITAGDVLTGYNLRGKRVVTLFGERLETVSGKLGVLVGAHTSIGMHCGVLPGVKIGEHCTIYPGTIVSRDIKDGRLAKSESAIAIYPRQ